MLKQMADSMNLFMPEFEEMMGEEHGLVLPDEFDDDEGDYYELPKRKPMVGMKLRFPTVVSNLVQSYE